MTAANIPNTIVNLTPADAVPVQQNFSYVETFLNSEVINRDGSVAMTAPLTIPEQPTQPTQAANKAYVDALFPVGVTLLYPGDVAPAGDWMLCQGQAMSTSAFPALFAVLGYRYGGAGSSFNLPDLRGRVPIGKDATQADIDTTGKSGGTTAIPLLAHTHTMAHTHTLVHTHEHPHTHTIAHTHDIDHNHASATTNFDGAHVHNLEYNEFDVPFGTGKWLAQRTADVGTPNAGTSTAPTHTHDLDLPNFTGVSGGTNTASSGAASDATTGGASTTTTSAASNATTTSAGTAAVTSRQPFLTVNYIIRTK